MKRLFIVLVASLFASLAVAQDLVKAPVWSLSHEPKDAKVGDEVTIILKASFEEGWHLYGANFDPNCGPIVTTVKWEFKGAEVVGDLMSDKAKKKHDEIFGCDITYFDKKGEFRQKIKVTAEQVELKGLYDCQLCQDDGMCIPFDGELKYGFKVSKAERVEELKVEPKSTVKPKIEKQQQAKPTHEKEDLGVVLPEKAQGCDTCCSYITSRLDAIAPSSSSSSGGSGQSCDMPRRAGWDDIEINHFDGEEKKAEGFADLIVFFIGAFLSGLLALMTPCVFPMLPMTVTFFTKTSKTKAQGIANAVTYGIFIILIYTIIGVVFARFLPNNFANEMATNWVVNLVFFAVFILFGLSFLGLFEITLPNSFINKIDSNSDKGGLVGIFFMAFTIVLVSFSCTGPIVSSILLLSTEGQWLKPIIGMFGYSLAFALPFGLFAAFPGWLNSLPKSGGWLNEVKVTLGLLEFAFALKFLSQSDQVENWGILDREVFLALWIAIFIITAVYLMGKIRMKSDSPIQNIGVFRLLLIIGLFSFSIYLIPGLVGAPLKSLAGVLPPMSTQDFVIGRTGEVDGVICEDPLYEDQLHLPDGFVGYYDLRQAICCARQQNKPIFVDFTGKACANCREMEQSVWTDNRVKKILQEDYVMVALYGDYNKITLPKEEWYKNSEGKLIKTIGKANSDLFLTKFKRQGQPFYLTLGVNELETKGDKITLDELTESRSFDKDVDEYIKFLKAGVAAHKEMQKK